MIHLTTTEARKLGIVQSRKKELKRSLVTNSDKAQGRDKLFDAACKAHGLPLPVHEYLFCPGRKFRADYVWEGWLIVERVGGVWVQGHHSRGQSQVDDMERRNLAAILGYTVLEFTPQQFEDGSAFEVIKRALYGEES